MNGFAGNEHLAENGERLRELIYGTKPPDERIVKESGLAICAGEDEGGFEHLGAGRVGEDEFCSD